MPTNKNNRIFAEQLLKGVFEPKDTLYELYLRRIDELKITPTDALKILGMGQATLNGLLNGTQKTINFSNLIKMSDFLQLPVERVVSLFMVSIERNFPNPQWQEPEKVKFMKENFDLVALKKSGFINSISDYKEIEKKILNFFELNSIFDYKRPAVDVAFSSGLVQPKDELSRSFFIKTAHDYFEIIDNPFEYNREKLIKNFAEIRWHSTNVRSGLKSVIRDLFKMGITIIYVPPLSNLHLRGGTFAVNGKPCIVLTNYRGFYPTLWFALIHELFHVLFDWDEIRNNKYSYHLSLENDENENDEQLTVREKEIEADEFAREYLFSKEKSDQIKRHLNDFNYVEEYAKNNHVHPSFIYVFHAKDSNRGDRMAWPRARRYDRNNAKDCLAFFDNPWSNPVSISTFIKERKFKIYN